MGVNWPLYETLLGNGMATNRREVAINESVNAFVNGMVDDPAYQENATVDGEKTPIVASRKSTIMCAIKAPPSTDIHIGDMVECFNEHWIVVELYVDKVGIINGEMLLCNNILRFQNRSANVITRYCVIDDGSYSRKSIDPVAYVPANTYKLYVSMDSDTVKMYIDKRLSFGSTYTPDGTQVLEVYKIIGMDLKSKNFGDGSHLMVLTMQRDVYNESTDDFANMLCDFYVAPGETPNPTLSGSCVIVGRDVIRIGTTRKYTVAFTDANGEPVLGIIPVWTVNVPTGVTQVVSQDGVVTVEVPLKEELIGSEISISVTDSNGVYGTFEKKVGVITVG